MVNQCHNEKKTKTWEKGKGNGNVRKIVKELWDGAWQERIQGFRKVSEKKCSTRENDQLSLSHAPKNPTQTKTKLEDFYWINNTEEYRDVWKSHSNDSSNSIAE